MKHEIIRKNYDELHTSLFSIEATKFIISSLSWERTFTLKIPRFCLNCLEYICHCCFLRAKMCCGNASDLLCHKTSVLRCKNIKISIYTSKSTYEPCIHATFTLTKWFIEVETQLVSCFVSFSSLCDQLFLLVKLLPFKDKQPKRVPGLLLLHLECGRA